MSRVAVLGVGIGRFGKRLESVQRLALQAFREALVDAELEARAVDGLFVGAVPEYHYQRSLAAAVGDVLGVNGSPSFLCEAACASGGAALRAGWLAIGSGAHKIVAVVGCQKMTDLSSGQVQALMGRVGDAEWETPYGVTFPSFYALFARRHMHVYGTTREQLSAIAVKNHANGTKNPLAMFSKEVSLEKVAKAPVVASPLTLLDCCANADGAACVLLADESTARAYLGSKPAIYIAGSGAASATMSVLRATDLVSVPSAQEAGRQAYRQAGIGPSQVKVAQLHDGFTITELMGYEDLGFCSPGEGGRFAASGQASLTGSIPCNTDGGIKSRGHPIGATGVAMMVEIVRQLRGECGDRQVPAADIGLTHNVGGVGQYSFVNVLRREA